MMVPDWTSILLVFASKRKLLSGGCKFCYRKLLNFLYLKVHQLLDFSYWIQIEDSKKIKQLLQKNGDFLINVQLELSLWFSVTINCLPKILSSLQRVKTSSFRTQNPFLIAKRTRINKESISGPSKLLRLWLGCDKMLDKNVTHLRLHHVTHRL